MRLGAALPALRRCRDGRAAAGRLLRLSLFQVTVGMATVLLIGTLNRVMIVELGVPAWLVALMVVAAAPLRAAPRADRLPLGPSSLGARLAARALYLVRHDAAVRRPRHHALRAARALGRHAPRPYGSASAAAALAFLLVGAGLHTTQTAGLALATDLAPEHARPRVVALLYVMLLVGMVVSALRFRRCCSPTSARSS